MYKEGTLLVHQSLVGSASLSVIDEAATHVSIAAVAGNLPTMSSQHVKIQRRKLKCDKIE